MPTSDNPFAAPESSFLPPEDVEWVGKTVVWRDGPLLVIRKGTHALPPRCIKTNIPTKETLKLDLYWHPPQLNLLHLLTPFVYFPVAFMVWQRATVHIGLAGELLARRGMTLLWGWAGSLLGAGMIVAAFPLADINSQFILLIPAGAIILAVSAFVTIWKISVVTAAKIDERFVWLKGAGEPFLKTLPHWPSVD